MYNVYLIPQLNRFVSNSRRNCLNETFKYHNLLKFELLPLYHTYIYMQLAYRNTSILNMFYYYKMPMKLFFFLMIDKLTQMIELKRFHTLIWKYHIRGQPYHTYYYENTKATITYLQSLTK